jgi:hypothetical protein
MIAVMLEKFSAPAALVVLFLRQGRSANTMAGMTDLVLDILFLTNRPQSPVKGAF